MKLFKRLFESKIDKLARKKKDLTLKREKLQRDMRARNSNRGTKIKLLENAAQTDYENTNKKVAEIETQIAKLVRDINSEQIYVNEVADKEKEVYLKDIKENYLKEVKSTCFKDIEPKTKSNAKGGK